MNIPTEKQAYDQSLLGIYNHPTDLTVGQWSISRSDRPHMYRIVHRHSSGETHIDTVVDLDNLESKLQKWRREGFVRHETETHTNEPAHRAAFMRDLRTLTSSDRATAPVSAATAIVGGVPMPLGIAGPLVPLVNPAYLFAARSKNVMLDILENRRIMLIGHTGTGKTSLIEQVAAHTNQGVLRSNMNGQTTIGDFVGFWTVKGGETIWVDGVLPTAMREGLWLIIDEIDFAEPAILAVLTAVLEPGGRLLLKEKGNEIVASHPSFRLFATANAVGSMGQYRHLYQGANLMNEAFLDRWRVYNIDYLSREDEARVLERTFTGRVSPQMAQTLASIAAECREAFIREDLASAFSTRRLLDWTELMLRTRDPEAAAGPTIYSKISAEDSALVRNIIEHHIALGD